MAIARSIDVADSMTVRTELALEPVEDPANFYV
jgi:hypothetical protein